MVKGYSKDEVIDYEDTYSLVARLKVIRLLLAFLCFLDFKPYQTVVKSDFLNGHINEEAYVSQPSSFEDHDNPNHIFKFKRALYGLKQGFNRGKNIFF